MHQPGSAGNDGDNNGETRGEVAVELRERDRGFGMVRLVSNAVMMAERSRVLGVAASCT